MRESGLTPSEVHPFPTTHWSLIAGAQEDHRGAALARLVQMYAPALRTYLALERRLRPNEIDDAIQGFIADRVLESRLIEGADPAKGKFRSLLLAALNNYLTSAHRYDTAKKRSPEGSVVAIEAAAEHLRSDDDPSAVFDRAWAVQLLAKTQQVMQAECQRTHRADLWEAFRRRVLAPCYEGIEPISYEAMVVEFGFKSPQHASNTLVTAKRMFDRILRELIAAYAMPDEIDDEVHDLFNALGGDK